ncbi:cell wall-associated hydrolase, partial [Trifolium pratense]
FPSRYYFTIGHPGVFSLARWSLLIHTRFHVSHATRVRVYGSSVMLSATRLSPSRVQHSIALPDNTTTWVPPPQPRFHDLDCSHFARRYYENHFCSLFLWLSIEN